MAWVTLIDRRGNESFFNTNTITRVADAGDEVWLDIVGQSEVVIVAGEAADVMADISAAETAEALQRAGWADHKCQSCGLVQLVGIGLPPAVDPKLPSDWPKPEGGKP